VATGRRACERVVAEGSRIAADALGRVKPSDVSAVVEQALIPRLRDEPLSPVVGQLLGEVLADEAHRGLVDLGLDELGRWLEHNEAQIASLIENRAPSWTPAWVDKRVASWVHEQVVEWIAEVRRTPDHKARVALDGWLTDLAHALEHDAQTMDRFERLKVRMLDQPQLLHTSVQLWDALRRALIGALGEQDGLLRQRALAELRGLGERLTSDPQLRARVDATMADAAAYVVNNYGHEVASVISATVNRWDGKETAERIELHVGKDLQFIRINGTVVGGLAGMVIHAFSTVL
jgi:uncharacterized membrane-anchored protein YjiN (DUF445 family)